MAELTTDVYIYEGMDVVRCSRVVGSNCACHYHAGNDGGSARTAQITGHVWWLTSMEKVCQVTSCLLIDGGGGAWGSAGLS